MAVLKYGLKNGHSGEELYKVVLAGLSYCRFDNKHRKISNGSIGFEYRSKASLTILGDPRIYSILSSKIHKATIRKKGYNMNTRRVGE